MRNLREEVLQDIKEGTASDREEANYFDSSKQLDLCKCNPRVY
jgi:hypothetical protein